MCDEHYLKVNDTFENLCRALSTNSDVNKISTEFHALKTNLQRVDFAYDLLNRHALLPKFVENRKSNEMSVKYRQDGNEMFKNKKDASAWKCYTSSIAHAVSNSEILGLAYANRSAVLYEKSLYKECLQDIRNAFTSNYPTNLYEKLFQRQTKAQTLSDTVKKTEYYEDLPSITQPNSTIQCASNSVRIKYTEDLGRHVVAKSDIKIGDVIAIEKPYAKILLKDSYINHCFCCFEACYNPKPCDNCTYALFCSEKCKKLAWNQFHKYDCPILGTLHNLGVTKLTLLALRVSICARNEYKNVDKYKKASSKIYKSDRYEEIHYLIANTHLRKSADLFPRSVTAAAIFALVEGHTKFFDDFEDEQKAKDIFKELILRHMQTGPTNFHEISELVQNRDKIFETDEFGAGAYSFLSLLNHSCAPNVVRHCHGSTIVLRALMSIQKDQQLFDNYGYHHAVMKRAERQRHLKEQYFFSCECEACEHNWPLYQYLPIKECFFELSDDQLISLKRGDSDVAKRLLNILTKKAAIIESIRPCRNLADIQECIKQCFAIFGNKRSLF